MIRSVPCRDYCEFFSRDLHCFLSQQEKAAIAAAFDVGSPAGPTIGSRLKMNTEEPMAANWLAGVARIAAWVLAVIIVALSLVPPVLRPETGVPHNLEHFAIYALAGLAFGVGYNRTRGIVAVLLVIFSGCVEIAQLFAPGRHARLSDFAVDAIAAYVGVGVGSVLDRIRTRS